MVDINKKICNYIAEEWLKPWIDDGKSQTTFAKLHNVNESTIRKIKGENIYHIPVDTLYKICKARKLSLKEFFDKIGT